MPPLYTAEPVPVPVPVPEYLDEAGDLFTDSLIKQFPTLPPLPAIPYSFLNDPKDDYRGLFWSLELPTDPDPQDP